VGLYRGKNRKSIKGRRSGYGGVDGEEESVREGSETDNRR